VLWLRREHSEFSKGKQEIAAAGARHRRHRLQWGEEEANTRKLQNLQHASHMPLHEEEESLICKEKRETEKARPKQEYLNKDVYESQGCYDNSKNGCAANDNYHGGEGNEEGAQEHEHGRWQRLVYDVDVLGEAVDDASYRCGVKERLGRVKFVVQQVKVQLLGCTDVPHG